MLQLYPGGHPDSQGSMPPLPSSAQLCTVVGGDASGSGSPSGPTDDISSQQAFMENDLSQTPTNEDALMVASGESSGDEDAQNEEKEFSEWRSDGATSQNIPLEEFLSQLTLPGDPSDEPELASDIPSSSSNQPLYDTTPRLAEAVEPDTQLYPFKVPLRFREPEYCGCHENPYQADPISLPSFTSLPILTKIGFLLSHTLYAVYHLPIRAIEFVMAMYNEGIMASLLQQYTAFVAFVQEVFPEADSRILDQLATRLHPKNSEFAKKMVKKLGTIWDRIEIDDHVEVYPVCGNPDCTEPLWDYTVKNVPQRCPRCRLPLQLVRHYGIRRIGVELQAALAVKGVEDILEQALVSKQQRDKADEALKYSGQVKWDKVWRQMNDGEVLPARVEASASAFEGRGDVLTVPLLLSCDWADLYSRRAGAHYSMGPITLPLANVPPQLRSSLHCNLLVGITPGPTAPRARNLHKLLAPVCAELSAGEKHGLWVRTPKYPHGKSYLNNTCTHVLIWVLDRSSR